MVRQLLNWAARGGGHSSPWTVGEGKGIGLPKEPVLWKLEPATVAKHHLYRSYLDGWWPILLQKRAPATDTCVLG